jgi:membrane protein YdbS with pleckstrin-like domain
MTIPAHERPTMSGRIEDHLLRSEQILVLTRRHAVVALVPITLALGVLVAVGALTARMSTASPLVDILWWIALIAIGYAGWQFFDWRTHVFVVTDRRVMLFSGFITRRVGMMPLVKVTDMTYQRTPVGRLLGYGDFIMESAGQDQALHRVRFLPQPLDLYHRVSGILFGRQSDDHDTGADLTR